MKLKDFIEPSLRKTKKRKFLLYGATNTGKSYTILKVALEMYKRKKEGKPFGKVYVEDCDAGLESLLERYSDTFVQNLSSVLIRYPTFSFIDMFMAFKQIKKVITPKDWWCVDNSYQLWNKSWDDWFLTIYGKENDTLTEYLKEYKRRTLSGERTEENPLIDWNFIKKQYYEVLDYITKGANCNVIFTAPAEEIRREGIMIRGKEVMKDNPMVLTTYDMVGFKPKIEKFTDMTFDTILFLTKSKEGRYITSIKNRGLDLFYKVQIPDKVSALQVWRRQKAREMT